MKTITITAYNRPGYLEQVLRSLVKNSLQGWHIFIALEPAKASRRNKQVIARELRRCQYSIIENPTRLGVKKNPYAVQETVFNLGSDINIYLEDDTIISPDITRLADWYRGLDLRAVVCLNLLYGCCGAQGHQSDPQKEEEISVTHNFNSLGYVCTGEQWRDYLSVYWYSKKFKCSSWDWCVLREIQSRPELYVLQPLLARANHIGRLSGTYCPTGLHDAVYAPLRINDNPNPGPYRLMRQQPTAGYCVS